MAASHALDQRFRQWPSAMRLVTAAVCALDAARARARRAQPRSGGRPSVPPMSPQWLLEYEVASSKHQDDR